jgi:UDPglucose 6-dehydrogenase
VSPKRRICVIGTGYVGVASAVGLAGLGHAVCGYDIIRERVHALAQGVPPYQEAGLAEALQDKLASGYLTFVNDLPTAIRDAAFIIVSVGTPSRPDGSADLSALEAVVADLLTLRVSGATVVLRSTVPCGTTEAVAAAFGDHVNVIYAPEFLREGHALADFINPDRLIIGAAEPDKAIGYADLFAALDRPIMVTGLREAELIKGFANAFLAMKISFANEVANFCDELGANALPVLRGIGADVRIGSHFLQPGIGFGGPCFEKDLKSLQHQAESAGTTSELASATLRVNSLQTRRIVDMLEAELGAPLTGRSIAVWGLTFKAGTDDVRDSLAVRIIDDVNRRGGRVVAHDPTVSDVHPLVACGIARTPLDALSNADALLVLTEWPEFAAVDSADIARSLRTKIVIDGRNVLDGSELRTLGVRYRGVGQRAGVPTIAFDSDATTEYATSVSRA